MKNFKFCSVFSCLRKNYINEKRYCPNPVPLFLHIFVLSRLLLSSMMTKLYKRPLGRRGRMSCFFLCSSPAFFSEALRTDAGISRGDELIETLSSPLHDLLYAERLLVTFVLSSLFMPRDPPLSECGYRLKCWNIPRGTIPRSKPSL